MKAITAYFSDTTVGGCWVKTDSLSATSELRWFWSYAPVVLYMFSGASSTQSPECH